MNEMNTSFFSNIKVDTIYNKLMSDNYSFKLLFTYNIPVNIKILEQAAGTYYSHPSKCQSVLNIWQPVSPINGIQEWSLIQNTWTLYSNRMQVLKNFI